MADMGSEGLLALGIDIEALDPVCSVMGSGGACGREAGDEADELEEMEELEDLEAYSFQPSRFLCICIAAKRSTRATLLQVYL
jgi:hypothetical protein